MSLTADVIYCEASPKCSYEERRLVASVIKNRIKHPGFGGGKLFSMEDVVRQKGAFSCISDRRNSNWLDISNKTCVESVFHEALLLAKGDFEPEPEIVYYHDKSVSLPSSWNNKYYHVAKTIETEHFIFYKIVET